MMDQQTQQQKKQGGAAAGSRRRLGRGLNALLGGKEAPEPQEISKEISSELEIAVDQIEPNPFQPRKHFDAESLKELASSIRVHGILQSLLVRPHGGKFQLIAGERRWQAAQQAGLKMVPCRLLELDDQAVCAVAIEENLKREDLGVLEKAEAFQKYLDRFESSVELLAKQLSMSRSALSNYLRLLELPETIKKTLESGKISNGHARALLALNEIESVILCKRIVRDSLSVRKTEQAVKDILDVTQPQIGTGGELLGTEEVLVDNSAANVVAFETGIEAKNELTPHLKSLQDQLRQSLGLKVTIQLSGENAGKVMIPFDSNDQFETLLRRLRRSDAA